VPLRVALVASFVVAGESRHQFLPVLVDDVLDELIGATSTQNRGHTAVMGDHHVTVLAPRPREALGVPHLDSLERPASGAGSWRPVPTWARLLMSLASQGRMMIEVTQGLDNDIDQLVDLEARLFLEDAGEHDPYAHPTWPQREGRKDFEDLIASSDGILLAARDEDEVIGLLAVYATKSSPTRQPVEHAVLRPMYVDASARRKGAAPECRGGTGRESVYSIACRRVSEVGSRPAMTKPPRSATTGVPIQMIAS